METAKTELRFEVYPVGLRFWVMSDNRPTEVIIRSFEIRVIINAETGSKCTVNYTVDRYAPQCKDGCGSIAFYSSMETPPQLTREKLIASLF